MPKEHYDRRSFRFKVTYFTTAGTVHLVTWTEATVRAKVGSSSVEDGAVWFPVMSDIVSRIRGLRDNGGQGALPGLEHRHSEGWSGSILIEHPETHQQRLLQTSILV